MHIYVLFSIVCQLGNIAKKMKSIGRYSIFSVPLGSQKAYCLVPRGLKCLIKKIVVQAIKEYRALDHGSVKRWRKGSWEGRVRLSHDPLHKTKIAVVALN